MKFTSSFLITDIILYTQQCDYYLNKADGTDIFINETGVWLVCQYFS